MANSKHESLSLSSPGPINDCGRKFNWIYFACGITGGIVGIQGGIGAIFLGVLIGCALGWAIKDEICYIGISHYRNITFVAPKYLPYETLIRGLIPVLTPLGMSIEVDKGGSPSITFRGIIYDLSYVDEGKTFRLWWRLNLARAFFSIDFIGRYRKVSTAMGIIAYY